MWSDHRDNDDARGVALQQQDVIHLTGMMCDVVEVLGCFLDGNKCACVSQIQFCKSRM
jgi:hypothetical protein